MFKFVVIGVGGTGSHFVRGLLQDIHTYSVKKSHDFAIDVTLVDEDRVERKNLSNQLFTEEEIGEYKADALAERYGEVYNVSVKSVTQYCKTIDMLNKLFVPPTIHPAAKLIPILVGMVDNNRTRQLFHDYFYSNHVTDLIWLDSGIEGIQVINKNQYEMTEEEHYHIERSGFSGQLVCGFKWKGETILEPVTDVYPNIYHDAHSSFPGESCGQVIIENPQRSATNKLAAQFANNFINNLLHVRTIFYHVLNFNAQLCVSRPTYLNEEQIKKWDQVQFKNNVKGDREQ